MLTESKPEDDVPTKASTIDTTARWYASDENSHAVDADIDVKAGVAQNIVDLMPVDGEHEVGSKADTSLANDSYLDHLSVEVGH
jgi:hypothetical protein